MPALARSWRRSPNLAAYWYLASYPKSGNTWCRAFITELRRLAQLDQPEVTAAAERDEREQRLQGFRLNRDLATGSIVSSRLWLDDQLGIHSSDLSFAELDRVRGRIGQQPALYAEALRYHKVHDAFTSPDSAGQPVVSTKGCAGVVYVMRHPADVAVSLSHFFRWDVGRCVEFLLNPEAALCQSAKRGGSQVRQFMGCWANHVMSWCQQGCLPLLRLRYEDLLANPHDQFRRLATFLGLPDGPALIAAAVGNTQFDKLRAKEHQEGGFHERPIGCERFFRNGRSGEGREQLQPAQFDQLQHRFAVPLQLHGYPLI